MRALYVCLSVPFFRARDFRVGSSVWVLGCAGVLPPPSLGDTLCAHVLCVVCCFACLPVHLLRLLTASPPCPSLPPPLPL